MFIPFGTREDRPKRRFPFITILLVLLNIAVFAYETYMLQTYSDAQLAHFFNQYAVIPANVTDGTPLGIGLLTSMFLHADLLHLLFNMLFLLPFGDNVEDRLGHFRYLAFYLLCGLAASLLHVFFDPSGTIPALGASGAISGVLAGYLMLYPRGKVKGLLFLGIILIPKIEIPAMAFIVFWFLLQLASGIAAIGVASEGGGVAFMAHVGGFIAGLLLLPLLKLRERTHGLAYDG
ncbi:MAG: rhomboid family protein [Candidatus Saccharibacteria bacterium]|nr:rhomboid family protein [Candidatus Saccharibacteria bacterium]